MSVAFSPDGRWLVAGDGEGRVTWLDADRRRPVQSVHAHRSGVRQLAFTPGSAWLASAGGDGRASLWAPPA